MKFNLVLLGKTIIALIPSIHNLTALAMRSGTVTCGSLTRPGWSFGLNVSFSSASLTVSTSLIEESAG